MSSSHQLTLEGNVPSKKNSLRRIKRGNSIFTVASEAHEAWHALNLPLTQIAWRGKETISRARVTLTFYPSTRARADATNKAESVMDLLVHAGVLEDDNWFIVPAVVLLFGGVDKENPRVEIEIFPEPLPN